MKKKILLVLLVVLMVGILAFSVFACNDPEEPKKPGKEDPVDPEPGDDEDYLTPMLNGVMSAIDNTVKGVNEIDKAASVSASIFVDVAIGEGEAKQAYSVKLDVKGSIDQENKNKNWAQIDADILGVKISLFAVNNGTVEDLYIAQNILNEDVKWSKLSQFEQANVLSNLACNSIIDLVKSISADTKEQIDDGIITGLAGGIVSAIPLLAGDLFVPADGAAVDFTTADGYAANLNVSAVSGLMGSLSGVLGGLGNDLKPIISYAVNLLLGANLTFNEDGSVTFEAGTAENTPTIGLKVGVEDSKFTGLELSYALKDISVAFGITDLSLSGTSKAYSAPFTGTPDELAIALSLDLEAPGLSADAMNAQVNIFPNVAMTFDDDGYVDFDFSGLYAYADLTVGENVYTIAEYNADGQEDLIIDLSSIDSILGANLPATMFKVPVNLQEKFDAMIAAEKTPVQGEGSEQSALDKNVVDYVVSDVIPTLINEDGSFNIGGLLGVIGNIGTIIEEITPILETEGLFTAADGKATLNIEVLMGVLLQENGIIDGITGEWNSFDLYFYEEAVWGWNADWTEYIELSPASLEHRTGMTLADLLAGDQVLNNIVALVNTKMYESYLDSFVASDDVTEPLGYVDYFTSPDAPTALTLETVIYNIEKITGATINTDNLYENLTVSVDGYAQDGIGFGIGATIGADDPTTTDVVETKALRIGLNAKIIENVAVADYVQKLIFTEQIGKTTVYDAEWNPITIDLSTDTGKDGGKWLGWSAMQLVKTAVPLVGTYVTDEFSSVDLPGTSDSFPYEIEIVDGTATITTGQGEVWYWGVYYSLNLDTNATITVTAADSTINEVYKVDVNYTTVVGEIEENDWTYQNTGSYEAEAGEVIICVTMGSQDVASRPITITVTPVAAE